MNLNLSFRSQTVAKSITGNEARAKKVVSSLPCQLPPKEVWVELRTPEILLKRIRSMLKIPSTSATMKETTSREDRT